MHNIIPEDILKIQKKLVSFEKDSRNYKKYTKILAKHIKSHTMKKRVVSHIKTIETVKTIEKNGIDSIIE
jgi:EAL domain-containing protein (putative c-di-GMP-specific phosphodiesterase class I)